MAKPIGIPQEVRASPPNPSAAAAGGAGSIAVARPGRASHLVAPRSNAQAVAWGRKVPVATVLQGAPIAVQMIGQANPAGLNVRPMHGLSAASNVDTSVSAQSRARRAIMGSNAPIVGDYTDAIRNAAGFAFGPPRLPKQGYMAAAYSYPSQAMVIGATLSGTPIVNPQPVMASQLAPAPKFAVRERGQGPRYQRPSSPSEDRRRMLATLQGLGAFGAAPRFTDPSREEVKYCNRTYPVGASAEQDRYNDLCRIDSGILGSPPWTQKGKVERGLPPNWSTLFADVKKAAGDLGFDTVGGTSPRLPPNGIAVVVGASAANTKTVMAPAGTVCPVIVTSATRLNDPAQMVPDAFKIEQDGQKLTVTRTDNPGGWGQNLTIACKPGTPPTGGGNTAMVIGGIAAVAAIGLVVMSRK